MVYSTDFIFIMALCATKFISIIENIPGNIVIEKAL